MADATNVFRGTRNSIHLYRHRGQHRRRYPVEFRQT